MADRDRLFGPPCGPYMIGGVGGAWGEGLAWEDSFLGLGRRLGGLKRMVLLGVRAECGDRQWIEIGWSWVGKDISALLYN